MSSTAFDGSDILTNVRTAFANFRLPSPVARRQSEGSGVAGTTANTPVTPVLVGFSSQGAQFVPPSRNDWSSVNDGVTPFVRPLANASGAAPSGIYDFDNPDNGQDSVSGVDAFTAALTKESQEAAGAGITSDLGTAPAYNFESTSGGGSSSSPVLIVVLIAAAGAFIWYRLKHKHGEAASE